MEKQSQAVPSKSDDNKSMKQKKEQFDNIVKEYLESNPQLNSFRKQNELEIRFGTNPRLSKPLSKIDYDNVVKQLHTCGFVPENKDGTQILRIIPETIDTKTGKKKMQIRAEIVGTDLIQEYCRTNSIQQVINMPSNLFNKVKFTKKMTAMTKDGSFINKLDMDDFCFRVSFQTEQDYNIQTDIAKNIISNWSDSKKIFRSMNRVRFMHPDLPVFADLSIVKSSAKTKNYIPLPQYTIQDAGVYNNVEQYEIELELDNKSVGPGTPFNTVPKLMDAIRKTIRMVLSGLQGTKFPVSYKEQDNILQEYMRAVHGDEYASRRVYPSDFIGPSSFTLQLDNITPVSETSIVPNIRKNFTVTDKADGDRKLLYVSETGKIFMIDTNMSVIFTGTKTAEKTIFKSVLDGEHIKHDRNGKFINLYAAFDIYYVNKKSVREFPFLCQNEEEDETKYRLTLLKQFIDLLKPISILETSETEQKEVTPKENKMAADFTVKCKNFKADSELKTIFEGCSEILSNIKDGTYEYNTDGLIFTPSNMAVGATRPGGPAGRLSKITWSHSFKWKPAEFNTIDFLVTTKKDKTGRDETHQIFQDGKSMGAQTVLQYKVLVLHVGFNPREDGFINPCQDILNDQLPARDDSYDDKKYRPVPFVPTDPYDPMACFCNIMLKGDGSKVFMVTEEGEFFEDDMIVEFKYVNDNADGWKWVTIRVRYDKTAQLRATKNNFGNAYKVANNNWYSIHHPITEDMITRGVGIPDAIMDEEVYYNRSTEETSTQGLRDFHNSFVKRNLIQGVCRRGDILMDFAVGKAGDLGKWIYSKLSFVFGIDYSKDNIHNQQDGACTRYLKAVKKNSEMPKALFAVGDSSVNIRSGQALATEKDKEITKAVFGHGPKDASVLGKGVYNQYGVGELGFNITSCQFALHYFFKNATSFHSFLRNVAECTKINGHFIGTCYDGKTVFNLLKSVKNDEGITIIKNGRKIYEIIKKYDQTGFPDEEMSLGYPINVFQESINKYFQEYLVNFDYLIRVMEDYGFILVTKEEARHMNMPNGTGMFSELFTAMENDVKRHPENQANYKQALFMSPEEKRISFMNRYFIFKKVRDVDVKKMAEVILKEDKLMEKFGEENMKEVEKMLEQVEQPIIKKKARLVLKKPTLPVEDVAPIIPTGTKFVIKRPVPK